MHKTRHFALDLEKDIRLSMTAGSKSDTGLFGAGHPRGVTKLQAAAAAENVLAGSRVSVPALPRDARCFPALPPRAPPSWRLVGGADRDRTDDLRLAKPALSQLSYSPTQRARAWWA
jgi:hypothetical protein